MAKKQFFQESELVFKEKPKGKFQDLTGQKFNLLTVLGFAGREKLHSYWFCYCSCGSIAKIESSNLKKGLTTSCGCFNIKRARETKTTHGNTTNGKPTKTYRTWQGMIARCQNPNSPKFSDYGGRGIKVCERWKNSFENFLADMGECPKGLTIERNDVNGNYCPENCRWATMKEQQNNRRNNYLLYFNGQTKNISQWAEILGINRRTLSSRIDRGWSVEQAFTSIRL